MREDIAQVVDQRARVGGCCASFNKGYQRTQQQCDPEDLPSRESMKERWGSRKKKRLHWSVLDRFLKSKVGYNWNQVYSEICERLQRNTKCYEARKYLEDRVLTDVLLIDGKPHDTRGRPLAKCWRADFWVHPDTQLLMETPREVYHWRRRESDYVQVKGDDLRRYVEIDGIWYYVTFKQLTDILEYDVVLKRFCALNERGYPGSDSMKAWGANIRAVTKRQANKREIRKFQLRQP